jgi:hypothetical protein
MQLSNCYTENDIVELIYALRDLSAAARLTAEVHMKIVFSVARQYAIRASENLRFRFTSFKELYN